MSKIQEHFFALTLDDTNKEKLWDPEEGVFRGLEHKVCITQVLLGPNATNGETNVVYVTSHTLHDQVTIPMCILKAGEINNHVVNILLPDCPFLFTLAQGKGPVHILGKHTICETEDKLNDVLNELVELACEEEETSV